MSNKTMWTVVAAVVAVVLVAGGVGAQSESVPADVTGTQAVVASKIQYQGRLTDAGGAALTGTYPMRFQIWSAEVGGISFWDSMVLDVDVKKGLFNVELTPYHPIFDGRELWLRIYVDGEWLEPRQELVPVPYALSLRPGATIAGDSPHGWGLSVDWPNPAATGGAIRATSATSAAVMGRSPGGYGLYGYSDDNYAVYGRDGGSTQARGYGGYFTSDNGIGAYGYSSGLPQHPNTFSPGVYGRSANGVGVYGVADGTAWPAFGVYGRSGTMSGVEGYSESGTGVTGRTDSLYGVGVAGLGAAHLASDLPSGYWRPGGLFYGRNGAVGMTKTNGGYAVFGYNLTASPTSGYAGVFMSVAGDGVWIDTPVGKAGLTITGGSKAAAVPTSEGERLLYTEESTEVWFSDYGFGRLVEGRAEISIDPLYAQTVSLDQPYHVFLQAYGDAELYVRDRTATGFMVLLRDGDPGVEFSYRIVARRLGYEEARLEPVSAPALRGGQQ
jgi:hypothetical protein